MSMVEKLKKYRMIKYLYNKKSKCNENFKKLKLNLPKSNSYIIKTETNNQNNIMPIFSLKTPEINQNNKIESKLRKNNTKLQLNLNKMQKQLILAKSVEHKKIFELKKKEKLLDTAINIKKFNLESEQDNYLSSYSFNIFQKQKENEITKESFKSNLLYKIKKQYLNLEKEHQKKINEITELKNNIRHCKNKDLILKNQKILNDFIELKKNYDLNMNKNNEYKLKMKDYIELEDKLTKKNFMVLKMQDTLKEITDSNINIGNDIEELKLKLKLLEVENTNLNTQINILNDNCNQVLINKKEIENKYAILIDNNNKENGNNISQLKTE
jgi:hypothetical protein